MDGRIRNHLERGFEAARTSVNTWPRLLLSVTFSIFLLAGLLISTNFPWHIATITQGRLIDAYLNASASIKAQGLFNYPVTVFYAAIGGLTLTNTAVQLKSKSIKKEGLSIIPGFAVAGCASCGVGLASLVGLGAASAALPFGGLGVKLAGIGLMIYALGSLGNADACTIPGE